MAESVSKYAFYPRRSKLDGSKGKQWFVMHSTYVVSALPPQDCYGGAGFWPLVPPIVAARGKYTLRKMPPKLFSPFGLTHPRR